MRSARWAFGAVVLGAGYGTVTSFVNDVSSQYGVLGSRIADTGWAPALKVVSQLLDVGWSWAALAVAAGWLVPDTPVERRRPVSRRFRRTPRGYSRGPASVAAGKEEG